MKSSILFMVLLSLSIIITYSYSQEIQQKMLKKMNYDGLKIVLYEVKRGDQLKYASLGSNYLIEIHDNNTIITKEEALGGEIIDTKFSDLDNDDNVEISLFVKSHGTGGYADLYFYEYTNYQLLLHKFPELKQEWKKFYRGKDMYEVKNNYIYYEFPAFHDDDANCCPTGGKVMINYEFVNNALVVKELNHDTTIEQKENYTGAKPDISITIKTVSGLPSMDGFSKTDCWIKIFVGNTVIGRTDKIDNDNSPYFNVKYDIFDYKGESFKIEIYDHDVSKEEFVGQAVFMKPISGQYPILFNSEDGSVLNRGMVDVVFEK